MRISENQKSSMFIFDLNRSMERMLKTQNDLSSTKRLHRPSDDPGGVAKLLRMKSVLARYERYNKNVDDATYILASTESSFNNIQDVLGEADSILMQASNDTLGAEERKILSNQMQGIWKRAVDAANQKFADKYVFGGTNNHEAPYELTKEIENEVFTADFDTAVDLDHIEFQSDTAKIGILYEEGTDYTIDYTSGEITLLSTGNMQAGVDYHISYETADGEVIDEVVNAPVLDTAVSLDNTEIYASSESIKYYFAEGTDYHLDEDAGRITVLSTGNMTDGEDYVISYDTVDYSTVTLNPNGVDGDIYRVIDEGVSIKVNISAEEAFEGENGVLRTLEKAFVALRRNDTDAIRDYRTDLAGNINRLTTLQGQVGSIQERLLFQEEKLASDEVAIRQLISSIEDTDLASTAVQLQRDQLLYEAALKAGASIIQTNLLDFLAT